MSDFTAGELANMRTAQTGHMMDTCVLQACVQTANAMNELVETWPVDGSAMDCGLEMMAGNERRGLDHAVLQYDARIRLPITATPNQKDRVKVTKRFGETLGTALVFEIVGPIQRGPSGVRMLLKRIEL